MYNSGSYKQNRVLIIVTKNNYRNAIIIIINHVDSFHFLPAPYDPLWKTINKAILGLFASLGNISPHFPGMMFVIWE